MIKKFLIRIWNSPTATTWFSFATVPINAILFLPLLLKTFNIHEVALWFLFSLFISLQRLADFGFYNTFVRVISYAFGGSEKIDDLSKTIDKSKLLGRPNWDLVKDILGTMKVVYRYASTILFVIFCFLSIVVAKQINKTPDDTTSYWLSWGIIIIFTVINFHGRIYSNYLLGLNRVALIRRIEGVFAVLAIVSNLLVLLFYQSFLLLILSAQFWNLTRYLRNRYLCYVVEDGKFREINNSIFKKDIFDKVWTPAWKGGVSSLASTGTSKLTGIIYAQLSSSQLLAEYLLALKIIEIIKNIAMAPFYSKIPLLSRLRAQGKIEKWESTAQRGFLLGNILLISGVLFLGVTGDFIFSFISSNVSFPNKVLWYLLGFAFFFHRYGAMHTQLYMTSNKVNSHISDTIAGVLFIGGSVFLLNPLGVIAFPVGMIIGYLGFYVWYAMYYSYKLIEKPFIKFELYTTVIPLIVFITFIVLHFIYM